MHVKGPPKGMRFKVVGADKETGDDVDVMVHAASQLEAEELALKRGIMVSTIKEVSEEAETISLIEDEPAPAHAGGSASGNGHPPERKAGIITVSANSPSETGHSSSGHLEEVKQAAVAMEYHILMNQALYLLETAVNRHIKDGWEPQGGLTCGISNNAMQFFQSIIRKKKNAPAASLAPAEVPVVDTAAAPAAAPHA